MSAYWTGCGPACCRCHCDCTKAANARADHDAAMAALTPTQMDEIRAHAEKRAAQLAALANEEAQR